jgi:uncharacterized protein (DUF488 family)
MQLQTIGYEATTIDRVIGTLRDAGTQLLIDVRAVAASRKPGFSKRQLAASLEQAGIGYVHLQGLGTPKPGRDAVRAGHPERMIPIFTDHMRSDRAQAELVQARTLATERLSCLLCFERDHTTCHRRLVAEMIAAQTSQTVYHLMPPVSG